MGGLIHPAPAATVVAALATATFLVDVLAAPLKLPESIRRLALTTHLGQPMAGTWNWVGIVVSLVLALGGLALGGWGMRRRDLLR